MIVVDKFKQLEFKVELYLIKIMETVTVKEMKQKFQKEFLQTFVKINLIHSGKRAIAFGITNFKDTEVGKRNPNLNYHLEISNLIYWNKDNKEQSCITDKYYKYKFMAYLFGYIKYYIYLYIVNCYDIIGKKEENEIIELY